MIHLVSNLLKLVYAYLFFRDSHWVFSKMIALIQNVPIHILAENVTTYVLT